MVNRFPSLVSNVPSIKKKIVSALTNIVNRFKHPLNKPREEDHIETPPPRKYLKPPWDPDFPHEFQEDSAGCGAAAFSMVYKALGHPVPQRDVFKATSVVLDISTGELTCLICLLYLDALARGFHVLQVRAINPIEMLKDCYEHSIKAITHERSGPSSIVGHCSVLIGIDDDRVYQHCSSLGPNQSFGHNEILERMAPIGVSDVGLGNGITLISNPLTERHICKECDTEIPEFIFCQNCGKQFRLSPSEPLGCIDPECFGHKWIDIDCPYCFQGIRRLEDRNENIITAEEWPQTVKDRQATIDEQRRHFRELFKSIINPDKQPKTK